MFLIEKLQQSFQKKKKKHGRYVQVMVKYAETLLYTMM